MRIQNTPNLILKAIRYCAILILACSNLSLAASDYEQGVQAYQNSDYAQAREYWERATADGNMSAAYNLGIILSRGLGGAADPERAVSLFRVAADAGIAVAQHNLALAYYAGNGVEKNNAKASIWWERAARHGHAQAQYNLGALLWNGEGIKKNEAEAIKLFRKASDAGNIQAQAFLNSILEQSDAQMQRERLESPGANDPDPAINQLLNTARDAYLQQDYELAHDKWKQASEAGNNYATYQLSYLYQTGQGVSADAQKSLQLIQQSANKGLAQAQYELAQHYLQGDIVNKNETLALYWMQSAADSKHIKARDYLEQLR